MKIYTDGACKGNPGPGGWGVAVYNDSDVLVGQMCGGELNTTNNRMELMAILQALHVAAAISEPVTILSDSQYAIKGVTEWLPGWKKKNWRTTSGLVKNKDLWEEIDKNNTNITWKWVKAHNGEEGNELADELANKGIRNVETKKP